jgi:hypothetical protein
LFEANEIQRVQSNTSEYTHSTFSADGRIAGAAAAIGIDRCKLYRRLRRSGVKVVKFLQEEGQDDLQFRGTKTPLYSLTSCKDFDAAGCA